jgi:hypothetical protein
MASGRAGSRPACRSAAARLGWPASRSAPMARLRRLAITRGGCRCVRWGRPRRRSRRGPSAAGLDPSVPTQPAGQLRGAGAAQSQAGDGVHGDDAPAAAAGRADAAGDLDRLGGVRKHRPATAATFRVRSSMRPWPCSRVRSITGICRHGSPTSWACRPGWLALTTSRSSAPPVDQEAGMVALGVQRVGGDHDAGEVQRRQQVHLVAAVGRAPQRLAVHREHAAVLQGGAAGRPATRRWWHPPRRRPPVPAPGGWCLAREPGSGG